MGVKNLSLNIDLSSISIHGYVEKILVSSYKERLQRAWIEERGLAMSAKKLCRPRSNVGQEAMSAKKQPEHSVVPHR